MKQKGEKVIIKRVLLLFVFIFILSGCTHGEKIVKVQPGMSIEKVKSIMGNQEGYKRIGDYEVFSYYNKVISGWGKDRADYHYIVKDGRVVEYGAGEIRQNKSTGVVFILPLRL